MDIASTETASAPRAPKTGLPADDRFDDFATTLRIRLIGANSRGPLFLTSAAGLWDAYLDNAPDGERQTRTCNCCRHFIERVGSLVEIAEDGSTRSALWGHDILQPMYSAASRDLALRVERAPIAGVWLSSDVTIGTPSTGVWTHFWFDQPLARVFSHSLKTASQAMAEKREERGMIERGLDEYPIAVAQEALRLLTSGQLYRSEKCEGVAKWLVALHEARAATKNERRRDALAWRAIATAPVGFAHVKSGMIGTLLDDIKAGLPFADIKRKFDEKMNPLQYQRPTAAPSIGNIAQAEKIIAELGLARSLERRFAKLADVQTLWTPRRVESSQAPSAGVFSHLKPKESAPASIAQDLPAQTMTWVKFLAAVLPSADEIDVFVPGGYTLLPLTAMVTAKHADAPPIVQWDTLDKRNPVSWYMYSRGSRGVTWNLAENAWAKATALVEQPSSWGGDARHAHQGKSVLFALHGCRDLNYRQGAGMFPELLKSDLHAVRATIEAYTRSAVVEGAADAEVCGPRIGGTGTVSMLVRVTSKGGRAQYKIDRWD